MGCNVIPYQPPQNNPEDPLNNNIEIKGACFPIINVGAPTMDRMPKNGEYSFAGAGNTCYYCGLKSPAETSCSFGCAGPWYDLSCCSTIGIRGLYKRTSYNADPIQCCLGSASTIDGLTCDPAYRYIGSEGCAGILKNYCKDKLFSDSQCKEWCNNNKETCLTQEIEQCNTVNALIGNPHCKTFCTANPGSCDTGATAYCTQFPTDPFCSCINSDMKKYKYNPACQDGNCIRTGYQTSNMITDLGKGCTVMDCSVYFALSNVPSINFSDNTIEQKCGNVPTPGVLDTSVPTNASLTVPQSTIPEPSTNSINSTNSVYIVVVVVFLGGIFFFVTR